MHCFAAGAILTVGSVAIRHLTKPRQQTAKVALQSPIHRASARLSYVRLELNRRRYSSGRNPVAALNRLMK
jgi:hypothetical protein